MRRAASRDTPPRASGRGFVPASVRWTGSSLSAVAEGGDSFPASAAHLTGSADFALGQAPERRRKVRTKPAAAFCLMSSGKELEKEVGPGRTVHGRAGTRTPDLWYARPAL